MLDVAADVSTEAKTAPATMEAEGADTVSTHVLVAELQVQKLRELDLKKSPSVAETIDWAKALIAINASSLDEKTLNDTYQLKVCDNGQGFGPRASEDPQSTLGFRIVRALTRQLEG